MFCVSLYLLLECGLWCGVWWCLVCGLRGAVCGVWSARCVVRNVLRKKMTHQKKIRTHVLTNFTYQMWWMSDSKKKRFSFCLLCWDKCHWSADFLFFIRWNWTWPEILSIFCVWTRDTLSNVINYNFFIIFASNNIAQTALFKNCVINQIQLRCILRVLCIEFFVLLQYYAYFSIRFIPKSYVAHFIWTKM